MGKNIIHRIPIAELDHSARGFNDSYPDLPVLVGDGLHQGAYQGLRLHVEVFCGIGRLLVMRYSCSTGPCSVATIKPFLWTGKSASASLNSHFSSLVVLEAAYVSGILGDMYTYFTRLAPSWENFQFNYQH